MEGGEVNVWAVTPNEKDLLHLLSTLKSITPSLAWISLEQGKLT